MKTIAVAKRSAKRRAGFTLAETAISTLLVGIMLVTATRAVGVSMILQARTANQTGGGLLADALMAEILQRPYADPNQTVAFGLETGESGTTRANYDDVDDYNGWVESPPKSKDGSSLSVSGTWQRSVAVAWVSLDNVTQTSTTETGMKRVTVIVARNGTNVATRAALVAKAP